MSNPVKVDKELMTEEFYQLNFKAPSSSYSEHSLSSIASHDECFKSEFHADVTLTRMHAYMLENQLTDVVLIAGSKRLNAHRLVLSAASEYFSAMFTADMRESTQREIALQDVDGDALSSLVQYCYTGRVEVREDTVESLLVTSCLLRLCNVVDACCAFLRKQLHPSNCVGIYLFADTQGCVDLRNTAFTYTCEHFMEVIKNQEFLSLPGKEMSKFLACEDLNVPNEKVVYEALMTWINHNRDERKALVGELMSLVKLPLLSPLYLMDHIENEVLVKENSICRELLLEAFRYHVVVERRVALHSTRTTPRKSTVGSLYAVGGMEANKSGATSIEVYSLRENKWSYKAQMPGRRLQFGVAVLGSKLFIVGGREGLKTLNTVDCYDVDSGSWTCMPAMSTHRHGLGVATIAGALYAVGGHDGWAYLSSVERWDPDLNQWSFVSPMLSQRSTVGVAVLNNKVYAVGGRDGSSCLRTVECYDPLTNRWRSCSPMAKRRGGVGLAAMNGFLYALGGHDVPTLISSAARFDCVERYDPKTDAWTTVACLSVGRDAIGVGLLGEKLIAVGGYDGMSYLKLVEAYDPVTNTWTQAASLMTGRAGSCVVVVRPQPEDQLSDLPSHLRHCSQ